jgi:hypothetical protein
VVREPKSFKGYGNTVGIKHNPFSLNKIEVSKMVGIYKIVNKLSGKTYIG